MTQEMMAVAFWRLAPESSRGNAAQGPALCPVTQKPTVPALGLSEPWAEQVPLQSPVMTISEPVKQGGFHLNRLSTARERDPELVWKQKPSLILHIANAVAGFPSLLYLYKEV